MALLILIAAIMIGMSYLYLSADMMTPQFASTPETDRVIRKDSLRQYGGKKERLDEQTLHAFQHANPHFFYVYELLGDYYHATGQQDKALRNWKKALLLPIPKRSESERIEHKINN